MLSGRRLDLLDPSPLDVEIEDIAHGLARVARWNGQTSGEHIFSVAQHSLLVEAVARNIRTAIPPRAALAILLHDSAEYVIGDIISPLKVVLGDSYKGVEARILAAVMIRFGLPPVPARDVAALSKQAVIRGYNKSGEDQLAWQNLATFLNTAYASDDIKEAVTAFAEKRKPVFKGG